jgi:regulator of protease activity HflC (stomatin/prohibitin superfamily)
MGGIKMISLMMGIIIGVAVILLIWFLGMYRVVPPSEAHMIVRAGQRSVRSTDKRISFDYYGDYD